VEETTAWITEKTAIMSQDYGRDLAGVEGLQRKHDRFVRDLAALEEKVRAINAESERLAAIHTSNSEAILAQAKRLHDQWDTLKNSSTARTDKLIASHDYQRFAKSFRDLNSWIEDMIVLLSSAELPKDLATSEAMLIRHQEHRAEIDAREGTFKAFEEFGQSLIAYNHYASDDIQKQLGTLRENLSSLLSLWRSGCLTWSRHTTSMHSCTTPIRCRAG